MNFNHEELMLMMLYNTGTRMGLIHELRLMQCYLMPDETALRELSDVYKRQHFLVLDYMNFIVPPDSSVISGDCFACSILEKISNCNLSLIHI